MTLVMNETLIETVNVFGDIKYIASQKLQIVYIYEYFENLCHSKP